MSKIDIEALYELLGSWEKVRTTLLNPEQEARLRGSSFGLQWDDTLMPHVLELVMSPVQGKTYRRRMDILKERQTEHHKRDMDKFARVFNTRPPWHSDKELVQKPTMSKRTRRRMKRRGELL